MFLLFLILKDCTNLLETDHVWLSTQERAFPLKSPELSHQCFQKINLTYASLWHHLFLKI